MLADPLFAGLAEGFKPKPKMTLSEWAEAKMVLPPERASNPGPYRVGDATFQRGMMDAVTDPDNEDIVFVTSSQVGKTTIIVAANGYYCEAEPCGQLSAWPNQDVADAYVRETFDTTVRDSPDWASVMTSSTEYKGGFIKFVGANTPTKLAMTPIRVVTGDEVDRWPISSGKEGSPVELAKKRRTTFHNRKGLWVSTPVHEDTSAIVQLFKETRQHYFLVTCPYCELKQTLKWDNVIFQKGKEEDAEYACEDCGQLWGEMTKRRLVREGAWHQIGAAIGKKVDGSPVKLAYPFKCFKPEDNFVPSREKVGYWINELYSPWSSMREMALAWSESEGNPEKEQTFFNTRLGLPYRGDISSFADPEGLKARKEAYDPLKVPKRAALLTAAVDVQDDRIEVLVIAWGKGDECWLLDHTVIQLDPSTDAAWDELALVLERGYPHLGAAGETLGIFAATVDSGGHFTQKAYAFSAKWLAVGRRYYAHKGVPGEKKPIWVKSEQRFKDNIKLFLIGVDDAKATIYTRYAIAKPGPGYVHIHEGVTDDQIAQMTAERAETEYVDGFPKRKWTKPRHRRNEMLDLMVYNHAVRCSVNIDMDSWITKLNTPKELEPKPINAADIGKLFK
jgi:phage terminase large subunit GpA-like protein